MRQVDIKSGENCLEGILTAVDPSLIVEMSTSRKLQHFISFEVALKACKCSI